MAMALGIATAELHRRMPKPRRRWPRPSHAGGTGRSLATPLAPAVLLELIWLASPALPVGGFSYSEGLEAAVDAGRVTDEATACRWLLDQWHLTQQRSELPLLAAAIRAWQHGWHERIVALNRWSLQTRETGELRQQTQQMGRSLALWLRQRQPADPRVAQLLALAPAPTWPVAWALAAACSGAAPREALLSHGFGWAENMAQAAIKAVPLGQSAGQRLLAALAAALPPAVDAAILAAAGSADAADAARLNFAPMQAVLSARHEAQYSRLFRS
jgi:urease accessory protein